MSSGLSSPEELCSPQELRRLFPLSEIHRRAVDGWRDEIRHLLAMENPRLAIVVGPCSIHNISETLDYATKLRRLADDVSSSCLIVMRVYAEKPRTSGGWKGLLYDPHLDGSGDIATGLCVARELLLELTRLGLPTAMEFLDPLMAPYLADLISWGFIGARTSSSQPHRLMASHLPMPIGFKNSLEGSIDTALLGAKMARLPHRFPGINDEGRVAIVEGRGNPHTHIVLRGSHTAPNYAPEIVTRIARDEPDMSVIIDCAHGNSQKSAERQEAVFLSALEQRGEGLPNLVGVMLESYLSHGSQFLVESPTALRSGVSITDPCIDWATTERLISLSALSTLTKR